MHEELKRIEDPIKQARLEISAIFQDTAIMGANSFEPAAFTDLLERLEKGDCSPKDAITEANLLRHNKHDDH